MGWLGALLDRLSGQDPAVPPVDWPPLGRIQPSHRPKGKPWLWETLDELEHERGRVSVTWEAGETGPSEGQVAFWTWLRENIDQLVEQARPLLTVDVEDWTDRPLPENPWNELIWVGAGLPVDGDRNSEWDLSFDLKNYPNMMLTVTFRDGKPQFVTADD